MYSPDYCFWNAGWLCLPPDTIEDAWAVICFCLRQAVMGLPVLAKTSLMREISPVYKIFLYDSVPYINWSKYPKFGLKLVAWGFAMI